MWTSISETIHYHLFHLQNLHHLQTVLWVKRAHHNHQLILLCLENWLLRKRKGPKLISNIAYLFLIVIWFFIAKSNRILLACTHSDGYRSEFDSRLQSCESSVASSLTENFAPKPKTTHQPGKVDVIFLVFRVKQLEQDNEKLKEQKSSSSKPKSVSDNTSVKSLI